MMTELAVLQELLAMIGCDDQGDLVRQAETIEFVDETLDDLIGVANKSIVERANVSQRFRVQDCSSHGDIAEKTASRTTALGHITLPEHLGKLSRRGIRIVHGVAVEKEKKALVRLEASKKLDALGERLLDFPSPRRAGFEAIEAAAEARLLHQKATLGKGGRGKPLIPKALRQGLDLRGQTGERGIDAVLLWVQTRKHRGVRDQGRGVLSDSILEHDASFSEAIQEWAGLAAIAVTAQMPGTERVERDQDVAASRRRRRRGGSSAAPQAECAEYESEPDHYRHQCLTTSRLAA